MLNACVRSRSDHTPCGLLLYLRCYLALRDISSSKQEVAAHVIRHPNVMRQNCRPKTKLAIMNLHPSERAFLTQLAETRDSWESAAATALSSPSSSVEWSEATGAWSRLSGALQTPEDQQAFRAVVRELLSGQVHSFLVALGGGSSLAETTLITTQDEQGHVFKTFLHEFWPEVGGLTDG